MRSCSPLPDAIRHTPTHKTETLGNFGKLHQWEMGKTSTLLGEALCFPQAFPYCKFSGNRALTLEVLCMPFGSTDWPGVFEIRSKWHILSTGSRSIFFTTYNQCIGYVGYVRNGPRYLSPANQIRTFVRRVCQCELNTAATACSCGSIINGHLLDLVITAMSRKWYDGHSKVMTWEQASQPHTHPRTMSSSLKNKRKRIYRVHSNDAPYQSKWPLDDDRILYRHLACIC